MPDNFISYWLSMIIGGWLILLGLTHWIWDWVSSYISLDISLWYPLAIAVTGFFMMILAPKNMSAPSGIGDHDSGKKSKLFIFAGFIILLLGVSKMLSF